MGKNLDITYHQGVITLIVIPGAEFRADPFEDDIDFTIFRGVKNLLAENEQDSGEIVGYEVLDIYTIHPDQIPDIEEKYDVPEMEIRDVTIKEIVLAIQEELFKKQRKTA